LIATNCIKHSSIYPTFEKVRYVDDETLKTWFRAHLQPNDILFVNKGTPGRVCLVPDPVNFCAAQDMIGFRCDKNKINYKYLFAVLRSSEIQKVIENNHVGLVIPHFRKQDLPSLMIPMRSPEEQEAIGNLYITLSEKIELNARINAELESMAKTFFRYQFVENKEKGSWEIGTLGDVAENIRRSANPNEIKPETHYIGLEHMPRKSIALAEYGNASELESNKYAFKTGEFLFGKLRPYFHKVGIAPVDGVCSTDILVIAPKSPEWYGFVLGHVSSDEIIKYADATSGGTKMPRTNWESLAKFEISMPPVELAKQFTDFFIPIAKQIRTNILESQTLTELRDWLLPMLMNGQVKV
jgi:type I restriction enzyme S subunit